MDFVLDRIVGGLGPLRLGSLPPARKEAKLATLRIIELLIQFVLPHADGPPRLQPRLAERGNAGTPLGERASADPCD